MGNSRSAVLSQGNGHIVEDRTSDDTQAQVDYRALEQKVQDGEQETVALRDRLVQGRQEMELKYNDLLLIIQKLEALYAQQALPDSSSAQVDYRAMEQKVLHRDKEIAGLHLKIEKLEALHAQQALPDSGSYEDSAATPPLLQNAADRVKDAIVVCASEFFSELRKSQSIINIYAVQMDIPLQQRSNEVTKAGLQGVLCRVLFQGFEDPYFTLTESHNSPFQTPSERKTALFQAFRKCRDCSEAMHLLRDDKDFRGFHLAKVALMNEEVKTWLLSSSDVERILNGILNPRNEKSIYNRNFLRAAKAVWVLHKLAMAFEPIAEIFRVGRGSSLLETYMEDVAAYDEDAEGNENTLPQKQVLFMCVPGFIIRHTVIKSRVFCLLNVKPESRDTTKDSQTETS